jgi:excisionase family DNA binding protein
MESSMSTAEATVAPAWLSYAEAQLYTGLGRTTLWKLCNTSDSGIVAAKVGAAVRIEKDSLDRFMRACADG